MDSKLMEEIFSNEDSFANLPTFPEDISEETKENIEIALSHMSRINPIEADMVELHLLKGVSQALLGKIFGYSQPNIHYRIHRGILRLRAYFQIGLYEEDILRKRLSGFFTDAKDIEVVVLVYIYSSQSHVARLMGDTQGKVRYRFMKCLSAMENAPNLKDIHDSLKVVGENLTLLRSDHEEESIRRVFL
jgi:hypothetical protein